MKLVSWGANTYGQLGIGRCSESELEPVEIECPSSIKSISCGANHTIIIDENGYLMSTGRNNRGQLGIGNTSDQNIFSRICFHEKFQKVATGWDMSAAISIDYKLFVWGSNKYGQLNLESKQDFVCIATLTNLPFEEKPIDIQFGLRFMSILTDCGNIYVVGEVKSFASISQHSFNSNKIKLVAQNVKIFSTGQNHIIYVKENDQCTVKGIGDNKYHQSDDHSFKESIYLLRCGWTFSCALTHSRQLYLWGRNSYGQLGNGVRKISVNKPQRSLLSDVVDVKLGAEHAIIQSINNIYTHGWNEHGSCGNGDTNDL